MGLFKKSVIVNCPWCNAELNGKTPRFGTESSQIRCPNCGEQIVAVSNNGNIGLFVR